MGQKEDAFDQAFGAPAPPGSKLRPAQPRASTDASDMLKSLSSMRWPMLNGVVAHRE
jgi:hypothetical protein